MAKSQRDRYRRHLYHWHLEFVVRHLQTAIEELRDPGCLDPPCLDDADAAFSEVYNAIEEGSFNL